MIENNDCCRLGSFNLSERGHAECVSFLKKFNVPLLLLGGGGYTVKNVARTWVYETAIALDTELSNGTPLCFYLFSCNIYNVCFVYCSYTIIDLPFNDYLEHYGPEYTLHIRPSNMEDQNTREYLEKVTYVLFFFLFCLFLYILILYYYRNTILQRLRKLPQAPSAAPQEIPPDAIDYSDEDEDEEGLSCLAQNHLNKGLMNFVLDPDEHSMKVEYDRIQPENEYYDDEEGGSDIEV